LLSLQEEFLKERDGSVELVILVGLFLEAVAFIFGHDVPDGCSLLFEGGNNLVAFADGNARVVLAGNHQHGLCDFLDVVHRGNALEELAHLGVAFVAIFHTAEVATIRLGMFEKGHQVRYADNVDRAANAIAVKGCDGQRHVAAVAAAGHANTGGIEFALRGDPVEQRVDVLVGVFAKEAIPKG